jgi:hypothetical protein
MSYPLTLLVDFSCFWPLPSEIKTKITLVDQVNIEVGFLFKNDLIKIGKVALCDILAGLNKVVGLIDKFVHKLISCSKGN